MTDLGVPRAVVNPRRNPVAVPAPAGPEVQAFHEQLAGYEPTPLHQLSDLAADLGVAAVLLKDESERIGLPAFKVLGASWAVERTLRADPDVRTLVTASSGNHGRAVARTAARRGLACRIYLPAGSSRTRGELIAGEGAEVVRVDGDYDTAVAAAELAAAAPRTALIADTAPVAGTAPAPTTGAPEWVIDGYSTLFREIDAVVTAPVGVVFVPAGVGSFAAAAARWAAGLRPAAAVVAVEPVTAACVTQSLSAGRPVTITTTGTSMAGMDCATPSAVAWPTLRDGLVGAVTVTDAEAHEAMRELAGRGLVIGDCGAATLAALRAAATDPRCAELRDAVGWGGTSRVLCIATEGASDPAAYAATVGPSR